MNYISISEFAKKWSLPERTVRNYCAQGKIKGAFIAGKTWDIPFDALLPEKWRTKEFSKNNLLNHLKEQKDMKLKGGIYHKTQIDLTYNSNRIEGSRLTIDQTRNIFETNTIAASNENINVDDIVETINHFRCFDFIIEKTNAKLTESFTKQIHFLIKSGTSDSNKKWFNIGEYKKWPNEVGAMTTCPPSDVKNEIKKLLSEYNSLKKIIVWHPWLSL